MRRPRVNEWLLRTASVADGTRPVLNNTWGTSVTPAQDAYGASFASLGVLSSTYDIFEWSVAPIVIGISTASRLGMIQIYADPAGGTSFTVPIVTDLAAGSPVGTGNLTVPGEHCNSWRFRRRIPAGWSLGVKGAVHSSTLTAFRVWIHNAVGRPTRPDLARTHEYIDTYGASVSTCAGVTITPGTTSEGAWTEIGTLSRRAGWFEYSFMLDDATATAARYIVDIALGDASNKRVIISNACTDYSAAEQSMRAFAAGTPAIGNAGDKIYARAQSSSALDDGTYSVAVYACGG